MVKLPRAADGCRGAARRRGDRRLQRQRAADRARRRAGARRRGGARPRAACLRVPRVPDAGARRAGAEPAVTFQVRAPEAAAAAFSPLAAQAEGVFLARDLTSEPANVLTTTEFAERLTGLKELGVEVEVLDEPELAALGMRTLLAVGQGSTSPSKVVVMQWKGGGDAAPLALCGKGVVFDTGGISIKPAAGMEEMTMDMGGAARRRRRHAHPGAPQGAGERRRPRRPRREHARRQRPAPGRRRPHHEGRHRRGHQHRRRGPARARRRALVRAGPLQPGARSSTSPP